MFRTKLKDDPSAVKINFVEHKGFTWVAPEDGLKMDLLQDEDPCFRLIYFSDLNLKPDPASPVGNAEVVKS